MSVSWDWVYGWVAGPTFDSYGEPAQCGAPGYYCVHLSFTFDFAVSLGGDAGTSNDDLVVFTDKWALFPPTGPSVFLKRKATATVNQTVPPWNTCPTSAALPNLFVVLYEDENGGQSPCDFQQRVQANFQQLVLNVLAPPSVPATLETLVPIAISQGGVVLLDEDRLFLPVPAAFEGRDLIYELKSVFGGGEYWDLTCNHPCRKACVAGAATPCGGYSTCVEGWCTEVDTDRDFIPDACDNCPEVFNHLQTDTDGDGLGDACDSCPHDRDWRQTDTDGDGVPDACDNCPLHPNGKREEDRYGAYFRSQHDSDLDGVGDVCESQQVFPNPAVRPWSTLPGTWQGKQVVKPPQPVCDWRKQHYLGSTALDLPSGDSLYQFPPDTPVGDISSEWNQDCSDEGWCTWGRACASIEDEVRPDGNGVSLDYKAAIDRGGPNWTDVMYGLPGVSWPSVPTPGRARPFYCSCKGYALEADCILARCYEDGLEYFTARDNIGWKTAQWSVSDSATGDVTRCGTFAPHPVWGDTVQFCDEPLPELTYWPARYDVNFAAGPRPPDGSTWPAIHAYAERWKTAYARYWNTAQIAGSPGASQEPRSFHFDWWHDVFPGDNVYGAYFRQQYYRDHDGQLQYVVGGNPVGIDLGDLVTTAKPIIWLRSEYDSDWHSFTRHLTASDILKTPPRLPPRVATCEPFCRWWTWAWDWVAKGRLRFGPVSAPLTAVALANTAEVRSSPVAWNRMSPTAVTGGLAMVTLDAMTGAPTRVLRSVVPEGSEPLDTDRPAMTGLVSAYGGQAVAAFGGFRSDLAATNTLWIGSPVSRLCSPTDVGGPGCQDPDVTFVWNAIDVAGTPPPARGDAILIGDLPGGRLILMGGADSSGQRFGDLWTFHLAEQRWTQMPGDFGLLAGAAHAFTDRAAYFFGGTEGGASSTMMRLDLATLRLEVVPPTGAWPAPRSEAGMSYDVDRDRLLLYGGHAGTASLRDVWAYSVDSGKWTVLQSGCSDAGCPPSGVGGSAWANAAGELIVVPGRTSRPVLDGAFRLTAEGWAGATEAVAANAIGLYDCNGDGVPEARHGLLCSVGNWWAPAGRLRCSDDGGLACAGSLVAAAPAITTLPTGRVTTARPIANATLAALAAERLDIYAYSAGAWARLSTITLPWKGRGFDASTDGQLLVVGDHHLAVYEVSTPSSPQSVAVLQLTKRTPWDIRVAGRRAVVASEAGVTVLARAADGSWAEVSSAQAKLVSAGGWEQQSAPPPGQSLEAHNAKRARELGWTTRAGAHLALVGSSAFVSFGQDLLLWDVGGTGPLLRAAVTTGDDLAALQVKAGVAYLWGKTTRPVVQFRPDGSLAPLGQHDLALVERRARATVRVMNGQAQAAYAP